MSDDKSDKNHILVRLKTARYALEQAALVAEELRSPHRGKIRDLLDEADRLYAEIAMIRSPE